MALGGISGIGGGASSQQGQSGATSGESAGKEFSLEKQAAGSASQAGLVRTHDVSKALRTTRIVTNKKKNRKGAPRAILVDGEIYEVFLLAIA